MSKIKLFMCLVVVMVAEVSCMYLGDPYEKNIDQTLIVSGNSKEKIYNPKIIFGKFIIPGGTNMEEIPPMNGMSVRTEIRVGPIPDVATVNWKSYAGVQHHVVIPVRKHIKNIDNYYGFKFEFLDESLNVYLIEKYTPVNSDGYSTKETIVFSS